MVSRAPDKGLARDPVTAGPAELDRADRSGGQRGVVMVGNRWHVVGTRRTMSAEPSQREPRMTCDGRLEAGLSRPASSRTGATRQVGRMTIRRHRVQIPERVVTPQLGRPGIGSARGSLHTPERSSHDW